MSANTSAGPVKGVGALLAIAALAAVLVGGSYSISRDRIAENERRAILEQISEAVAASPYDNDPLTESFRLPADDRLGGRPGEAYPFRSDGEPAAMALVVTAPNGYSGPIRLLIGMDVDGTVLGVRAVNHRETPGLGDAIDLDRSDWITQFAGRSLESVPQDRWKLAESGGEFEQITAATVTSKAVVAAVASALTYYDDQRARLWQGEASGG